MGLGDGDVEDGGDLFGGGELGEPGCGVGAAVAGGGDEVVGDGGFDEGGADHKVFGAFGEEVVEGDGMERVGEAEKGAKGKE